MNPPAPFIVGVGRSGTTLLRLMLDAHPDLAIPSETMFLKDVAAAATRRRFLEVVTGAETWPNMAMTKRDLRRAVTGLDSFSRAEAVRCFYRLYAKSHGKTRWGDKTPYYRVSMRAIAALLPEAHFIHVIRDGRDSALSYRGLWFGPGDDVEAQAQFWRGAIEDARAQAAGLPRYSEVRYEALVAEPESTLRAICRDIDLAFDPTMLDYHATAAERLAELKQPYGPAGRTPDDLGAFMAIHDRAKQPPDSSRIGRWRTEMPPQDQRSYESVAGPLLRALGYETVFDS